MTEQLDLTLTRDLDISPALVWKAWTDPEQLLKWFTPDPWRTVECDIDLRPGGRFRTVMRSPEGQDFPNQGCYLEIVENRKLVWTNALEPGFRPALPPASGHCGHFLFTAVLSLEPLGSGTRYSVRLLHGDEAGRKEHEEMGFHDGWNKALDQLVARVRG
ncbi:SRPBCC family protein [Chitinimonas arctica]|nr:SRPBCC family protein [Chitinimonas arctica]